MEHLQHRRSTFGRFPSVTYMPDPAVTPLAHQCVRHALMAAVTAPHVPWRPINPLRHGRHRWVAAHQRRMPSAAPAFDSNASDNDAPGQAKTGLVESCGRACIGCERLLAGPQLEHIMGLDI